ncbi:DEAD/DEAH box helicase [Flammeovirga yaeyamensis]|uniref:DEAD/DEAH box helicase n=1 Tax=Flammeovirga yaeyamensis TaxID=367791 RepID=A0AAX1N6C2_9BACT|nr:DEAD/DEAH box helicase [Flammeovirga yaeyamensis]MBB3697587.1 ATP-dependent RNA helicase RhlE [Flammeovirga yaeyamensis]NMF36277.1 DEAD/DEAH box helicase [Flammeovirga yaeyamensis]QWG03004.1 DEAD/DEAH box helicase [Flammeovirga yaeyamensis]
MQPNSKSFDLLIKDQILLDTLSQKGFDTPTPIQELVIPQIINQTNNLLCVSPTGSGKTLSYLLPLLQLIQVQKDSNQLLVIVPTRELATQVYNNALQFCEAKKIGILSIIGGVNMDKQKRLLENPPHIIVSTMGRLMDLYHQECIDFKHLTHLVIDEGDKMFEMGFRKEMEELIDIIPDNTMKYLFSATLSSEVDHYLQHHFNEYQKIEVAPEKVFIEQKVYYTDQRNKKRLFLSILSALDHQILIFCNTKKGVNFLEKTLKKENYEVMGLHGGKPQSVRNKALLDFKEGKLKLLIATDIASRGIDIKALPLIINYEVPQNAETYTHRIGRTARAGNAGTAMTIVDGTEIRLFQEIIKTTNQKVMEVAHEFEMNEAEDDRERMKLRKEKLRNGRR